MSTETRKAFLVGSGIGNLAAAAYMIKDGGLLGPNITIYEEEDKAGGVLDAFGEPGAGYFMRGERMFEANYVCLYDLMSFIPSLDDPHRTIKQDTLEFNNANPWNNKARLVVDGKATNFESFGFNEKDLLELFALTARPENAANGKRIDEVFSDHFFTTNFWHIWKTLFAFNPWHSAIEMRRYLIRFMHLFPDIGRQNMIHRTRYNQYDSIVRPMLDWLTRQGVRFVPKSRVLDIGLADDVGGAVTANTLLLLQDGREKTIEVRPHDIVIATLGSMGAGASFGSNDAPPGLITDPQKYGSWALWETLSLKRKDVFRDPSVFTGNVDQSKFACYTVTQSDPRFFERMEKLTANKAGRNGITTLPDSNWVLSFIINIQPYYRNQPKDVYVFYGITLFQDKVGNFVRKKASECTGRELLEELLRHLKFDSDLDRILDTSIVRAVQLPYGISQFMVRKVDSRPDVVPRGSTNLGLTGQFVEVPYDCVFTMDYSIRSAQMAVYQLLGLDKQPTPYPRNEHDLGVLWGAARTLQTGLGAGPIA